MEAPSATLEVGSASEIAGERPAKPPERVIANNLQTYRELAENYGIGQVWATQ